MRVRFKKKDLLPAAAIVQDIANPQSTLPILSNVLITTDHDNIVSLSANDYETRVRVEVPAEVDKKGMITMPAKTFYDLIKELPEDGEVLLETKEKNAMLRCRDIRCELQTMPARDFPKWPDMDPKVSIELDQKEFKSMLSKVLFAIPVRDPRKVLLGALFEFKQGRMSAVATDGKILAFVQLPAPLDAAIEDQSVIIAHKMLSELIKTLDEGSVTMSFDERQVAFRFGNTLLVANQVEGKYPNYSAVVPKEFQRVLRFQRAPMQSALRRASILSDIKHNAISLNFSGDQVLVEAESYDKGRLVETVPAVVDGDDFKIVFNHQFVNEVLKAVDREEVLLQVNLPSTPAVFKASEESPNFYLVMPIKLTELADLQNDQRDSEPGYEEDTETAD